MGRYAEPIKSKLKRKKAIYGNFLHNILVNFALNNKKLMNINSETKYCQTCGIPLDIDYTNLKVDQNEEYCDYCRECNLNSVWFLFLLNHNKYNFFFLDLQMLLKVVFGCVQGRRRMSRLYTLAHIRELPFLCV